MLRPTRFGRSAAAACKGSVAAARPKRAVRQAAPAEAHGSRTASSSAPFGAVWAALAALWSCATTAPARSREAVGGASTCRVLVLRRSLMSPSRSSCGVAPQPRLFLSVDLEHFIGLRLLRVGSFVDVPCFSVMTGVAVGLQLTVWGDAAAALVVRNAVDRRRVSGTSIAAVDGAVDALRLDSGRGAGVGPGLLGCGAAEAILVVRKKNGAVDALRLDSGRGAGVGPGLLGCGGAAEAILVVGNDRRRYKHRGGRRRRRRVAFG